MRHRIAAHLASPLLRNGYALIANTFATAGLGALFWIVAARLYTPADLGINAALLSAMVLLAKLGQVNLVNALNRFIPSAGAGSRRFVIWAYALAGSVATVLGIVFVAGVDVWAPDLGIVRTDVMTIVGFVLATAAWAVFVLQDAALTGLRRSTWIPLENGAYSLAKLGLVAAFAVTAPRLGIFIASVLPLAFILLPVNWLIFRKAIPEHVSETKDVESDFAPRAIAGFAVADFGASLGWVITIDLLPVIVLGLAGAEASAFFFLAWTIAYTLFLVSKNTGMALVAEAVVEPARLWSLSRRSIRQTLSIVVPVGAALALFAPVILSVFGPEYSAGATGVLRLLLAAAIPTIVVSLEASILRIQRRLAAMAALYTVLGAGVLGISVTWTPTAGIVAVGWAWLITTGLIVGALLATELRPLWLPGVLSWPVVDHLIDRARSMIGRGARAETDGLAGVVGDIGAEVLAHLPSDLDLTAATLRSADGGRAMVKVAHTETASASLRQEAAALAAIHEHGRFGDWTSYVPRLVSVGTVDERAYLLQEFKPGRDGRRLSELGVDIDRAMVGAARAVSHLHRSTSSERVFCDVDVHRLVDEPLEIVLTAAGSSLRRRHRAAIERVRAGLHRDLLGATAVTSWIHGDYWLGNVLIGEGADPAGIVDWGGVDYRGMPAIDIVHLILTTRMMRDGADLGAVVLAALASQARSEGEEEAFEMVPGALPWQTLVLLTWLHHLAMNLSKSDRYRSSWLWTARNIDRVLGEL